MNTTRITAIQARAYIRLVARGLVPAPDRHLEAGLDERHVFGGRGRPPHHRAGAQVARERDVGEPRPGRHVGEIGDPGAVRASVRKSLLSRSPARRAPVPGLVAVGGLAHDVRAGQPHAAESEPGDGVAGHVDGADRLREIGHTSFYSRTGPVHCASRRVSPWSRTVTSTR
jgi:hypothetical protein